MRSDSEIERDVKDELQWDPDIDATDIPTDCKRGHDLWYCENSLPLNIVSDHDKIFVSKFWKALHVLTGIKLKMLLAYHPETDGSSKQSNKTI